MNRQQKQLAALALAAQLRKDGLNYRQVGELVGRTTAWVYHNFGPTAKRENETRGRPPKDKRHVILEILKDRAKNVPVSVTCAQLRISKSYYQYLRRIALGANPTKGRPKKDKDNDDIQRKSAVATLQGSIGELPTSDNVGQAVRDTPASRDT